MNNFPTEQQKDRCYDNTKISAYKTCPRSYFIRHVLHWRGTGTGLPLIFGLSWHEGQDIVWKHGKNYGQADLTELASMAFDKTWEENDLPLDIPLEMEPRYAPRTPAIAREMYWNYIGARAKMIASCDVVAIEQPLAVPVPGLPNIWYIGRLDKVVDYNGQRLILEHKTTTAYATVGNFRSDYVDSWFMAAQIKGYQFGGGLFYGNVDAVWVDAALVHKKIHDAFKFIPVSHNFVLLNEWIEGTKGWITSIVNEEEEFEQVQKLTPGLFKKNEESCFGKYGSCPFLDICRSIPDPSQLDGPPPGYQEEKWEPFDVLGLGKLVRENS